MDLRSILNTDGAPRPPPPPRRSMSSLDGRSSDTSVSPKTLPPPTPISKMSSPFESRKRSFGSISQPSQQTPTQQPAALKRRKYEAVPIWAVRYAQRAKDNHRAPGAIKAAEPSVIVPTKATGSMTPPPIPTNGRSIDQATPSNGTAARPVPTLRTDSSTMAAPPSQHPLAVAVTAELPPSIEPNFDNIIPFQDLTKAVADQIFAHMVDCKYPLDEHSHWEIEAKLGTIENTETQQRIKLPVSSEVLLEPGLATRFVSRMDMAQHKHLNEYLNTETQRSNRMPGRQRIGYKHTTEIDSFYDFPERLMSNLSQAAQEIRSHKRNHTPKVRVTRDKKTNSTLATIMKFRIQDLDIYCPKSTFDYRISLSLEYHYPHDLAQLHESNQPGRFKDRMSYSHQFCQMDLTQVVDVGGAGGANKSHEMEVELDAERVVEEGRRAQRGEDNSFMAMVTVFLNYIRALGRADMR